MLDTRAQRWLSDREDELAAASARLVAVLAALEAAGIRARGHVGDSDLGRALNDVVQTFEPTEILISTYAANEPSWLDLRRVRRVEKRFGVRISRLVIEPEPEETQSAEILE